ncbi:DNA polymerase III subunit delta' [Vibrio aphrogenes]|uniref:DNA polymerase III subunit delta' n=1 Tax=Vibrio aphrogenes TaxID=1891186 RepID=UPI000B36155A|nr:DNA polymerase III subunit delta' [Vibrio aphrogenes]
MTLYPWLSPLWHQWQSMLSQGTTPNAMLCNAKEGTGIESLIARLSAALVCKNAEDEACGFCHSCELSKNGSHPDIHWVQAEQTGKAITVEQIREANRYALESSQLGGKRVIIIHPAEAMNESASNALLKTLETPPQQCVFILVTQDKHKLLATITSRCQFWSLPEVSKPMLLDWLKAQSDKAHDSDWFSLKMYAQSPLKALDFIENDKHQQWEQMLTLLLHGQSHRSYSLSEIQLFFKDNAQEKLLWLLYLFNDLQKAHFGLFNEPLPLKFEQLMAFISYQKAYSHYQMIQSLYAKLTASSSLNTELLITDWYLDFIQDDKNPA